MRIKRQDCEPFYDEFLPLIAELLCGRHYVAGDPQHVAWLKQRVSTLYASGGTSFCLYADDGAPLGFLLLSFDKGLDGVRCFGKKASIAMFGLHEEHRGKGFGASLLKEAERFVLDNGGECLYVDTYAGNADAVRYYVKHGFTPVAYHPGENGLDDKGQVYLFKGLGNAQQ